MLNAALINQSFVNNPDNLWALPFSSRVPTNDYISRPFFIADQMVKDTTDLKTFSSSKSGFGNSFFPNISTTGSGAGASTAKEFEYYMADLAQRYGMDRSTAYNEALANTSYQRAVADMQQAGLNPAVLFGNGRVSGASSPYTSGGYTSASGNARSGNIPGWMYYGVTAIAQIAGTFASKNPMVGYSASMIAQNVMKALNNM